MIIRMIYIRKLLSILSSKAVRAIYQWTKPVHKAVLLISVMGIISSLASLWATLVTKKLIDSATSGNADALWKHGVALVILIVFERGIAIVVSFVRNKSNSHLQMEMQKMVTTSIMGKDYASIKPYHSGELVNRVFSDVSVVKNGVMNLMPSTLRIFVSFIGAVIILVSMDWRFIPAITLASFVGVIITVLFREPMKNRHKRMQEAEDALHASTQETLESIRVVKAAVSENRALTHMNIYRENLHSEQVRNGKLSIYMNQGLGSVFDVSWLVCQLWGCIKIYQNTFTYGSLAALIQLVGRIQAPIANAVQMVSQAYGVVSSAERLMEVISLPDDKQGVELKSFESIRLKEAYFQYNDSNEEVLLDLNEEIKRGDFVALTGISGGGKTSLFQLLLGIYRPTSGSIMFLNDGNEINACRGTRGLFSYVPQGNTLMSGTLKENITMFTDVATEGQIKRAVSAACLEDLVAEIGFQARLGERGIGLSEGQAQRVAIARALLSDAPILLLDEATSALDEQTEAKVLENISKMRDKTVIIVTHRRAALTICDYQLHIENGRMTRIEGAAQ